MIPSLPSTLFPSLLLLPLAATLFLLPGIYLVRLIGAPSPWTCAFLASAGLLFNFILLANACGWPIHAGTLTVGFGILTAVLVGCTGKMAVRTSWKNFRPTFESLAPGGWIAPVLIAAFALGLKVIFDPLSGVDNAGRWNYLAHLFLRHQSLVGYPPVTASDFESYGWCDGIPPLVPFLNLWIYATTHSIHPALTSVRIAGEAGLLGGLVYAYAQRLWGNQGGWPALAGLATSALLSWGISIGQETGLTALALVAVVYFVDEYASTPRIATACWAGLAAGVGALSREYGLAYVIFGMSLLGFHRRLRSGALAFLLTASAVSAPWYLRNWNLTGNPLFPHTTGHIFPGNPIHDETMRYIADIWSIPSWGGGLRAFAPQFAILAGFLGVTGLIGAIRAGRRGAPATIGMILMGSLWLWSVPQTAGGWTYSLRVLTPALALAASLSGWLCYQSRRFRQILVALTLLLSVDAARRCWFLPLWPQTKPWDASFLSVRRPWHPPLTSHGSPLWSVLVGSAAGEGIVVDHPTNHNEVTNAGGRPVPLFSPALADTFGEKPDFASTLAELRSRHIRFVTVSQFYWISDRFFAAHSFWNELCLQNSPTSKVQGIAVYDLAQLALNPTPHSHRD